MAQYSLYDNSNAAADFIRRTGVEISAKGVNLANVVPIDYPEKIREIGGGVPVGKYDVYGWLANGQVTGGLWSIFLVISGNIILRLIPIVVSSEPLETRTKIPRNYAVPFTFENTIGDVSIIPTFMYVYGQIILQPEFQVVSFMEEL